MKTSACRDGTLKNQPNEMEMTLKQIHTIPQESSREQRDTLEIGWEGEDAWSVKYGTIELWCSQRTIIINSNASSEIVNLFMVFGSPSKAS